METKEMLDIVNDILTHSYASEEIKAYVLRAILAFSSEVK